MKRYWTSKYYEKVKKYASISLVMLNLPDGMNKVFELNWIDRNWYFSKFPFVTYNPVA